MLSSAPAGGSSHERAGMTQALSQDVTMTERCLRIEAHHVDGSDPSLAYVAIYTTDERGQWMLLQDFSCGPFDDDTDHAKIVYAIMRLAKALLR